MVSTYLTYRTYTQDLTRSLARTAAKPDVLRDKEYYETNIGKVRTVDEFISDRRLFGYAMKAYGLEDMTYAKAFMRKVLTEGIAKSDSFANQLTDRRYRVFADAFNFAQFGKATTIFDITQQGTVDRYLRQTLEEDAGSQDEGVRLALYFERKAAGVKSPFGVLADPALLKVVQVALNLPATMSLLDIEKQADMITARLNIEDLKDPEARAALLKRFTTLWELSKPKTASTPTIQISQRTAPGIGGQLLASLQNLKLGGG